MAKWFNLESAFPFSRLPLESIQTHTHTQTRVRVLYAYFMHICMCTILNVKINATLSSLSPYTRSPAAVFSRIVWQSFYTLSCGWWGGNSQWKANYILQFCINKVAIANAMWQIRQTFCLTRTQKLWRPLHNWASEGESKSCLAPTCIVLPTPLRSACETDQWQSSRHNQNCRERELQTALQFECELRHANYQEVRNKLS